MHDPLTRSRLAGTALILAALATHGCGDRRTVTTEPFLGASLAKGGAGSLSVNLDQWANEELAWQNGDLNGNNSAYAENDVVPFRLAIEGLSTGTHKIHINYDFTAGGHKAYDFLATYNLTESPGLCAVGGGAVSSLCTSGLGSPSTFPLPVGGNPAGLAAGLSVAGAVAHSTYNGSGERDLIIYGGTITSITGPTYPASESVDGNQSADIIVTFTSTGSAVLFAWGGHLAESGYWDVAATPPGPADGAGEVSGAPWHMRTQQLENTLGNPSGNKNQDRSIQPSAIQVFPPVLTLTKTADASSVDAGQSIGFTITAQNTGGSDATGFSLSDPLPSGTGINWSIASQTGPLTCVINGSAPSQTLNCPGTGTTTLAAGATQTVHVTSSTTGASCGTYNNSASVTLDNGTAPSAAQASTTVQCPNLAIVKVPDAASDVNPDGTVNPGETAVFKITVSNTGSAAATNVVLTDTLPAGLTWTADNTTQCADPIATITVNSVSRQKLVCNIGTLAALTGSFTVTLTSNTIPSNFLQNDPSPAGSPLEIDGDLVDATPSTDPRDWASLPTSVFQCNPPNGGLGCAVDLPTGTGDNSFGQGSKEDTPVPSPEFGSIPNNKSDLRRFYVARERFGTTDYLYLAWERVQDPTGTTNMDFELNQSNTLSSNQVTPVRTAGDILVRYDLANGGTNPQLSFHRWVTSGACESANSPPCWGPSQPLNTDVAATINTVQVSEPIFGGNLTARTFGEARVNLQASGIFPAGTCTVFGKAYLKSRSSDSFSAALKDFIAPVPVNISNCSPKTLSNTAWVKADNFKPSGTTTVVGDPISDSGSILVTQ